MAETTTLKKYLDSTGLSQVWTAAKGKFVEQVTGKGLSEKDFTDALKTKLDNIEAGAQVNIIESISVNSAQVVPTDKGINIVVPTGELANKDKVAEADLAEALANLINSKVTAVEGKGLSTNDYDNAEKAEVAKVKDKVDKVDGKGLSTNDYDDTEKAEVAKVKFKANSSDVYTKTETDAAIKTATSLVYKAKGTSTFENLPSLTAEGTTAGWVYNVTNAFTTTDDFVEGAGAEFPAGTNVLITNIAAEGETQVLKYDCLAGVWDFSDFLRTSDVQALSAEEIAELLN